MLRAPAGVAALFRGLPEGGALIPCPRCQGCVDEVRVAAAEGVVFTVRCLNCGWYAAGQALDTYGPLRRVAKKGSPEETRWQPSTVSA